MTETTFDLAGFCQMQTSVCEQGRADAARRAATQHPQSYSEREREEHLTRAARALAHADVRLERAVAAKRAADHELADATSARREARDRYTRAVARCASAPDTSTPEENPRP